MRAFPVLLLFLLAGCYKEKDYEFTERSNARILLSLTSSDTILIASGEDKLAIRVQIPYELQESLSKVKFTLSQGTFAESKSTTYETNLAFYNNGVVSFSYADATIISGTAAGQADLNVTIDKYGLFHPFIFTKNFPVRVTLQSDSVAIPFDPFVKIGVRAVMAAEDGSISNGQTADVQLYDSTWKVFGTLIEKKRVEATNNQFSFRFSPLPDSTYAGKLFAVASATGAGGPLSDTSILYIIK